MAPPLRAIRHAVAVPISLPMTSTSAAAARAAAAVAAGFGITPAEPLILSDGANVIVHLSPSPVVAKVAATTMLVRPDVAAWLQRELDVVSFLARANAPVLAPSAEIPATTHTAGGHVMSFWRYHRRSGDALPGEAAIGSMLRDLQLAVCERLRRLHLTVWYALYAERLPGLRQRAAELLASWRPP